MRKLTKLLAVVILACLLCGIIATSVFAGDEATKSFLDVSNDNGVKTQKHQDYNGDNVVADKDANGNTIINQTGGLWDFVDKNIANGVTGDNYLKLSLKDNITAATPETDPSFLIDINYDNGKSGAAAPANDYLFFRGGLNGGDGARFITLDFDLCAPEYIYTIAGKKFPVAPDEIYGEGDEQYILLDEEVEGAEAVEGGKYKFLTKNATSRDLSYVETDFAPISAAYKGTEYNKPSTVKRANASGKENTSPSLANYFKLTKSSQGVWQLEITGATGGELTPVSISQVAGEWNHITVVVRNQEAVRATPASGTQNIRLQYFVNGKCVGNTFRGISSQNSHGSATLTAMESVIAKDKLASGEYFSLGIDNIAVTTYAMSVEENAGFTDRTDTLYYHWNQTYQHNAAPSETAPLLQDVAKDIVYNKDTYCSPSDYFAVTKTVGNQDTTVRYATQAQMLAAAVADADTTAITITSTQPIVDYTPDASITEGLQSITIKAPSVTLSQAAKDANYSDPSGGNGEWTVSIANKSLWIKFFDDKGEPIKDGDGNDLPAYEIIAGDDPTVYIPYTFTTQGGVYFDCVWEHEDWNQDEGVTTVLHKMDEAEMSAYETSDIEPLAVNLKLVENEDMIYLVWEKFAVEEGGDAIFKDAWINKNNEVLHPSAEEMVSEENIAFFSESAVGGNEWYDKIYTDWTIKSETENSIVFEVDPNKFTAKANVQGIKYNYDIWGNFTARVYGPVVFSAAGKSTGVTTTGKAIPSEIEYLGFSDANGTPTATLKNQSYATVEDGKMLNTLSAGTLSALYVDVNKEPRYISFKLTIDGKEQTLTQPIESIGMASYTEALLRDYGCGSEEGVLALSILNYINCNSLATGRGEQTTATAILNQHKDCCKEAGEAIWDYEYTQNRHDFSTLFENGVEAIQFRYSLNQPGIEVLIPLDKVFKTGDEYNPETDSKKINKVVFRYYGIHAEDTFADQADARTVGATIPNYSASSYVYMKDEDTVAFRMKRTMYDATATLTIELWNGAETPEMITSAQYSIADYMDLYTEKVAEDKAALAAAQKALADNQDEALNESLTAAVTAAETTLADDIKVLNAAKGIYFFGKAAYDYKVWSPGEPKPEILKNKVIEQQ